LHRSDWFWTLFLFGALLLVGVVACSTPSSHEGAAGAPGRGVYIQEQWRTNRRVTGHALHVMKQHIACNQCHEFNESSVGKVSPSRCALCHAAEARIEHAAGPAQKRLGAGARADCVSCHAFTADDTGHAPTGVAVLQPYRPSDCARCHQQAQGQLPAVTIHATTACLHCHAPHQDQKPVAAACDNCHKDIRTTHAELDKSGNGVCTTCHTHQHAPAADAVATCVDCHSKNQPIVPATALFAGGHTQCVGCHRPHAFEAQQAVECRSCHQDVVVLAATKVPEHARCTSCHTPHDVRHNAAAACANCHQAVHSNHPELAEPGGCLTCHNPHPGRDDGHALARACSGCHQLAASDHGFHGQVPCQSCHTPHHFVIKLAQRALCQNCHQKELSLVTARTGHTACEGCHSGLPHNPSVGHVPCETCHAAERRDARPGHQVCTGCHEPHSGSPTVQCETCHEQQFATAPTGHRTCTNCHQPHSGSSAQVRCANCHAAEAASAHGGVAGGCATCHRAHGPNGVAKVPECTTCHALTSLPGLHAQAQHHDCTRCHGGHGDAPNAARGVCLGCHADRKEHFPEARCANCHLFDSKTRGVKAP
jgi:hypothetical protein